MYLILGVGRSIDAVQSNVNGYIRFMMRRIQFLSLEMAPEKTESVLFWGRRRINPASLTIRIGNTSVQPGTVMKYLGIILDSKLNFK